MLHSSSAERISIASFISTSSIDASVSLRPLMTAKRSIRCGRAINRLLNNRTIGGGEPPFFRVRRPLPENGATRGRYPPRPWRRPAAGGRAPENITAPAHRNLRGVIISLRRTTKTPSKALLPGYLFHYLDRSTATSGCKFGLVRRGRVRRSEGAQCVDTNPAAAP
ncbi:hypothetical protein EVAR_17721_1 [Eumeta japonica]|uniref:Uncharacterized protein n=1 Tax=Eumeta variegata TaxID=151549 RepID=A0A4C1URS8_EUMVA|nr:hypothetical protein EVAR_17721_1 [Eumeta japonica]